MHPTTPPTSSEDPSEGKIVENFLVEEGVDENTKTSILSIIKGMGFKEEIGGLTGSTRCPEFGVVQDADRLDAIGAIAFSRKRHKFMEELLESMRLGYFLSLVNLCIFVIIGSPI
ncbi:uncharacterized protein LOC121785580 isoform X1 [Salvia splendens]|uniref:uncharacterized protein LOC121785580 isoform X1 n=1 Tax=Salvia splendens TaxID=180675 RepID=UPI001C269240|nr:uncharacterized protein LOC121785580 isoform X1 [Salvia splendens]